MDIQIELCKTLPHLKLAHTLSNAQTQLCLHLDMWQKHTQLSPRSTYAHKYTNVDSEVHKYSTKGLLHTQKQLDLMCNCVSASILPHSQAHTALGQGDSGSSEPAVTCRSRCSGKPLLTATIDDLIKLSPRRSAAGGGDGGMAWVCVCGGGGVG